MFRGPALTGNALTITGTLSRASTIAIVNNNSSTTTMGAVNCNSGVARVSANNNTSLRFLRNGRLPNVTTLGSGWFVLCFELSCSDLGCYCLVRFLEEFWGRWDWGGHDCHEWLRGRWGPHEDCHFGWQGRTLDN